MDRLFLKLMNTCVLFLCCGNVRAIFHILLAFQLIMSQDRTAREIYRTMTTMNFSVMWRTHHVVTNMMSWCQISGFRKQNGKYEHVLWGVSMTRSSFFISQTRDFWFLIFLFASYYVIVFVRLVCSNVFHAHFLLSILIRKSVNQKLQYKVILQLQVSRKLQMSHTRLFCTVMSWWPTHFLAMMD